MKDIRPNVIADLNDRFRETFFMPYFGNRPPGSFVCTAGITALQPETQITIWFEVAGFRDFGRRNDPYGEHDFGRLSVENQAIIWKIDYYADARCEEASDDPADCAASYRVLTIMLASEY